MKIFLFDIDGTLTQPRKSMSPEDAMQFVSWIQSKERDVYIVSGSDRGKALKQLPSSVLSRCTGLFCCMGNEFWDNEKDLVYRKNWNTPRHLIDELNQIVLDSEYDTRTGNHIEHRPGMINFSTVGRNASRKERDDYGVWDAEHGERKKISDYLRKKYKNLDVNIGGQISIDINPKGNNKSLAVKWLRKNRGNPEFVFFGDKCYKGGNDYDIVEDITMAADGYFFQVDSPKETLDILHKNY